MVGALNESAIPPIRDVVFTWTEPSDNTGWGASKVGNFVSWSYDTSNEISFNVAD